MDGCCGCCFNYCAHGSANEATEKDSSYCRDHHALYGLQAENGKHVTTQLVCLKELIQKSVYLGMIPLLASSTDNRPGNRLGNQEKNGSGMKGGSEREHLGMRIRSKRGKQNERRKWSQTKIGEKRYETIPEETVELADRPEPGSGLVLATNPIVRYPYTQSDQPSDQIKVSHGCFEFDMETYI